MIATIISFIAGAGLATVVKVGVLSARMDEQDKCINSLETRIYNDES